VANQNFKVKKGLEVGTGVTISDGNINISGIITAQFKGDGSQLTGVTASGSGVVVQEEGSNIGTAATINFIGSNVTAALSGGIANVTVSGGSGGLSNVVEDTTPQLGGNLDLNSKDITGAGNISITGGFNATGVSTFQENVVFQTSASFGDNDKINVGTGNDLQIFHDGTSNIISDAVGVGISLVGNTKVVGVLTATGVSITDNLNVAGIGTFGGNVILNSANDIRLQHNVSGTEKSKIIFRNTGAVDHYAANGINFYATSNASPNNRRLQLLTAGGVKVEYQNSTKLETTTTGIEVTGLTDTDTLNVSGISTFNGDITLPNNQDLILGDGLDDSGNFKLYNGANAPFEIFGSSKETYIRNTGSNASGISISANGSVTMGGGGTAGFSLQAETDGTAKLYGPGPLEKLRTTSTGVVITGVATATSFSGSGSGLTGLTGASAGTYGASTNTPIITVDSNGRITGIATVATSGAGGGGGISNIVEDTTPQLGGNLDLNSKSITGTGNIEITGYAAVSGVSTFSGAVGFATHIHDAGTGGLDIRTNLLRIKNDADSETLATFAEDGAVSLYHDNALRLATTNTGVSITDSLSVAGISTFSIDSSSKSVQFKNTGNTARLVINMEDSHSPRIQFISSDGDTASLYGDSNANVVLAAGNTLNLRANTNETVLQGDGNTTIFAHNVGVTTVNTGGVSITGVCTATSFSGDGSGLTGLPAAGITTASSNVQATWSVTSSGSSAYRFTGPGNDAADNNPDLYLIRGQRYRFTNNSGGSHPFQIRSAAGGSAYSTGVTNNGGASGNIDFNVQHDAPERLYYQCTSHSAMVGNIYIVGASDWRMTDVNTSTAPEIYTTRSVGIGTANPGANLDVEGTLLVGTSGVANGTSTINGHLTVDRTGVSGSNAWLTVKSSGSTVFYVNGGGSVFADGGVNALGFTAGTSGSGDGNSSIFGSLTVDRNGIASSNTWFQVKNGTTPIIYANGQGKVGIGTDNASEKLHVQGDIRLVDNSPRIGFHDANAANNLSCTGGIELFDSAGNRGAYMGATEGSGFLSFGISPSAGANPTEKLRIQSGGGISFNGDTAQANALDDYEEGTWSPNIGGTATYDIQWGYYIKIGKSVQCWGGLRPDSMGTGNAKQIQNLPFTAINSPGTTYTGGGAIVWFDNSVTSCVNTPALAVQPNATYAVINLKTSATSVLQDSHNFWQNNNRGNFFITYQTN
jgi:hypothetical protein